MWVGRRERKKKKEIKWEGKEWKKAGVSDQISNVHGHFLNSSIVEGLNVSERALVIFGDHVDSDALSAKAAATSNTTQINDCYHITTTQISQVASKIQVWWSLPVDIVLPVGWKIIVDDQRNLLYIYASCLTEKIVTV